MQNDPGASDATMVPVWTVERVEDTTAYAAGKGAVRIRRIHYRLFDGTESYVELPLEGFTADKAAAAIETHAVGLASTTVLQSSQVIPKGG